MSAMKYPRYSVSRKVIAWKLLVLFWVQILLPSTSFALTGGPSQPEVQSFEPVSTSEMVDLFSGDFNYNIPLLDIDGYPINISYHSGITMDQEASWVGLGWNINAGVINRNIRGIPDDFNGDLITKRFNIKANRTFGVNYGFGAEIFGSFKPKLKLNYSIGIKYNNYNGIGAEQSLTLTINSGKGAQGPLSGALGLTSSSDEGITIAPSVSMQTKVGETENRNIGLNSSIGSSFNSRSGLKSLSISSQLTSSLKDNIKVNVDGETKTAVNDKFDVQFSYGSTASSFNFSQTSYSPKVDLPMKNLSITGKFSTGSEAFGLHPNGFVGGYYSKQALATNQISNPSYGYLHAEQGAVLDNALMDFNREKDGTYTESTPSLPLAIQTFDTYSVSGQGIAGSFRPYRGDLGHVSDPTSQVTSDGYSIGGEAGAGIIFHAGFDLNVNNATTISGKWRDDNFSLSRLNYHSTQEDPLYEKVYFKEANEKGVNSDEEFYEKMGGSNPQAINLREAANFYTIADEKFASGQKLSTKNYRQKRENRNSFISHLSNGELNSFALEDPNALNLYNSRPDHHIGEVTSYSNDGKRYVYGIAAYNVIQNEVTFAVADNPSIDPINNLVSYSGTDNSISNENGFDHYFNEVETPAFAHSYLLTAVLSADYVDSDSIRGPSDGDLGSYTKFHYSKVGNYNWRVPVNANMASYNEGLKSNPNDDKANYLYGVKELYYLKKIETKNYVAEFVLEPRADARSVNGSNGGVYTNDDRATLLLRSISLYTKPNYISGNPIPIKKVNFEYDYSLCKGIPNFYPRTGMVENYDDNDPGATEGGKLTLKKIYFTYQKSWKGRLSPYKFEYSAFNPDYCMKAYDRWGNFKKPNPGGLDISDFPYVNQIKSDADVIASAWTLKNIILPSGGEINIEVESDDYAFVQNKPASEMFIIEDVDGSDTATDPLTGNPAFHFRLHRDEKGAVIANPNLYASAGELIYYRFLVDISGGHFDYVSGYSRIESISTAVVSGDTLGVIQFKGIDLASNDPGSESPVVKSAIQFGRIHLPKLLWTAPSGVDGDSEFGLGLINALVQSFTTFSEIFKNPNVVAYDAGASKKFKTRKSWIRLKTPNGLKYGGGARVKAISLNDSWNSMTSTQENSSSYGQVYNYRLNDGSSSGVASYEPQLGGDENTWKQPVFYNESKLLVPDDSHYMEEPFGESLFPGPGIGYSEVTVRNLQRANVHRHATGSVVHSFYTAKDFPTITKRTPVIPDRDKSDPWSIKSILKIDTRDYLTASQGYSIEINDMHGKPKGQMVYAESQDVPISSIEYRYKSNYYLPGSHVLTNNAMVIADDGFVSQRDIGINMDMVTDYRESLSRTISAGVQLNVDVFSIPIPPLAPIVLTILTPWPTFAYDRTQFRSAVTTKLIQRFGILDETIATDLGSKVSTKNLAYDAETGEVLLTETTQDFNDPVYSLKFPAHWYYEGMAPSSRNQDAIFLNASVSNGQWYYPDAKRFLIEGDEVGGISGINFTERFWVSSINSDTVNLVNRLGLPVSGQFKYLKILRSGHRNQQAQPMAQITTLVNPLASLSSNAYAKVLQAGAIEYTNSWKTFCDCFQHKSSDTSEAVPETINPYILGTKGIWKPQKSYTYLTDRVQSKYNSNTNIRRDGVFAAFTPFYKIKAGKWQIDSPNWTYTSEVTEFSPFGQELENKDALGKFSAATFGFNQTLATSVSANSRYRDIGFESFEDYGFSQCSDNHFKIQPHSEAINRLVSDAHTGRNSIKIASTDTVTINRQLFEVCELPEPCNVNIGFDVDTNNLQNGIYVIIDAGDNTYSVDWSITGGVNQKDVSLFNNGINIKPIENEEIFSVRLTISLSNGCVVTRNFIIRTDSSGNLEVLGLNPFI